MVAASAIGAFWPGVSGGFIFDDYSALVGNPAVKLTDLSFEQMRMAFGGFDLGGFGRPFSMITFGVNHFVSGGFDPFSFKVTNLLLHALNAALVFLVLCRVFGLAHVPLTARIWCAALIGALWAVHPLQVSTALYVVQRMEMLSTTFVLLSLLAYLSGRTRQIRGERGWTWILLSAALIVPGILSKETAILLPVYALAMELTVLGFSARNSVAVSLWRWGYITAFVVAVVGYLFLYLPQYGSLEPWASRGFDSVDRILTQLRVLPLYLQQILVPVPSTMTFYYDNFAPSRGLFRPWTTAAGLVFVVSILTLVWFFRKRLPLFSLGLMWFFGGHILTSNAQSLELVFEHRNYFASLGALVAAFGLVKAAQLRISSHVAALIGVLLFAGVGSLGVLRAATWGDPLLLATHQVDINPDSGRAKLDLGVIYYGMANGSPQSPFYTFALRTFDEAARTPTGDVQASTNLILMKVGAGRSVSVEDWGRLIHTLSFHPVSAQSAAAVWTLFDNRDVGSGVDPDQLLRVLDILMVRRPQPAFRYAQVGDYLRNELHRLYLAKKYYLKAAERAQGEANLIRAVIGKLIEEGEFSFAAELGSHARRHGVNLTPPPIQPGN
jgi:hypothetical protein